ncbi:MAG: hypothetical protein M5U26_11745 [Planctomycetota bacterium]|nr:hypothetical protein [Planctomycetota bacterium]
MNNHRELVEKLKALGVLYAVAHYDGYGDSGTVESVEARDMSGTEVKLPDDLRKAVEEAAERYLEDKGIDWYNNEGGYGDYTLDVSTARQRLDHNERISDVESFEHEDALDLDEEEPPAASAAPVCTCPTLINGHHPGCPFVKGGA